MEKESGRCASVLFGVVHGMHEALEAALCASSGWAKTILAATLGYRYLYGPAMLSISKDGLGRPSQPFPQSRDKSLP